MIPGGEQIMIAKFSVENFKGFKDKLVFDLTRTREYTFNSNLVENGLIKKGIVYGKNGTGKSNLGFALYDLTVHLTDKQKPEQRYYANYSNLNNEDKIVRFSYEFQFNNKKYIYSYGKTKVDQLVYENLYHKNKTIIEFNYIDNTNNKINVPEAKTLRTDLKDNNLSILKYIYKNTILKEDSPISKIVKFAESMLWFRCLNDGNKYIGLTSGSSTLDELIINSNKLKDFELFLKDNGLNYNLISKSVDNQNLIFAIFEHGEATFNSVASTGTKSLWLYYCWSIVFKDVSFAFIDEFDAFYHYETAEIIVKAINDNKNMQAIVTSHNTYLMKNAITRPDCCFILSNNKITSLCDSTLKEIREAHNLEKMYRNGAFTE